MNVDIIGWAKRNRHEIMTGMSLVGVIATVGLTAHDTVKFQDEILRINAEDPEMSKKKRAINALPCYIPTAISTIGTCACIIATHNVSEGKTAAYASAYALASEAANRYRDSVKEVVNEKKTQEIEDKYAEKTVEDTYNKSDGGSIIVPQDKTLCFDTTSGRYFYGDPEDLRKAINDINQELYSDMWVSLNTFYERIPGLDECDMGEMLGWTVDDGPVDLQFGSTISRNNRPCLTMTFNKTPSKDYNRL